MAQIKAYLLIFLTVLVDQVTSEYCYSDRGYYKICPDQCCRTFASIYCCRRTATDSTPYDPEYTANRLGTIVGIVIGCFAGLVILICVIVCCCCLRRRSKRGQVLQPHTNLGFFMATSATNGTQMAIGHPPPEVYSHPTPPQMSEGYISSMTGNAPMNNPYGFPPQEYSDVAKLVYP